MEKTKQIINKTRFTHTYRVTGCIGRTKNEILDYCDGNNFGGSVYINDMGCGTVEVYID